MTQNPQFQTPNSHSSQQYLMSHSQHQRFSPVPVLAVVALFLVVCAPQVQAFGTLFDPLNTFGYHGPFGTVWDPWGSVHHRRAPSVPSECRSSGLANTRFETQEHPTHYTIAARLPHVLTQDVEVQLVRPGVLQVSAARRFPAGCRRYWQHGAPQDSVTKQFRIPADIEERHISASMDGDVLYIALLKQRSRHSQEPRRPQRQAPHHGHHHRHHQAPRGHPHPHRQAQQARQAPVPPLHHMDTEWSSARGRAQEPQQPVQLQPPEQAQPEQPQSSVTFDDLSEVFEAYGEELNKPRPFSVQLDQSNDVTAADETVAMEPEWYHTPIACSGLCSIKKEATSWEIDDDGVLAL